MNATETAKKIQREYDLAMSGDKNIARMYARIADGSATLQEVSTFATMSGRHIANILVTNLPEGAITEAEAIELIPPALRSNHQYVADVAKRVQDVINESNGIGLKAIEPEFDTNGATRIAQGVAGYENVLEHGEEITAEIINASRKVVDRSFEINAGYFDGAGLETTVQREYDGVGLHDGRDECGWCLDRAGVWSYAEAKEAGVFQRHVGCGCDIVYMTSRKIQRQTNWRNNQWEDISASILEERRNHGR